MSCLQAVENQQFLFESSDLDESPRSEKQGLFVEPMKYCCEATWTEFQWSSFCAKCTKMIWRYRLDLIKSFIRWPVVGILRSCQTELSSFQVRQKLFTPGKICSTKRYQQRKRNISFESVEYQILLSLTAGKIPYAMLFLSEVWTVSVYSVYRPAKSNLILIVLFATFTIS